MTQFIVHGMPGSPYGRAVLATLEEKKAPYRVSSVAPGSAKSQPHLSRHPFGRVPTLEHDGYTIYETQAILRYLDRVLPLPSLTPSNPKDAGLMDQLMNICDWYLMRGVNDVIGFHRIIGPRLLGLAPNEVAIADAMPKAYVVLNELSRLLGKKAYLADEQITLADMLIAPHLDFLAQTPEWTPLTVATPNLVSWLQRMNTRPSLRATTWEQLTALANAS
jgi:glutathione S-transferase